MGAPPTLLHLRSFSQRVLPEMQLPLLLYVAAIEPDILECIIAQGCQHLAFRMHHLPTGNLVKQCKRASDLAPLSAMFGTFDALSSLQTLQDVWHR